MKKKYICILLLLFVWRQQTKDLGNERDKARGEYMYVWTSLTARKIGLLKMRKKAGNSHNNDNKQETTNKPTSNTELTERWFFIGI